MSTSQRTFEQVKSILGKLDRDIDAARSKRLQTRAISQGPQPPAAAAPLVPPPAAPPVPGLAGRLPAPPPAGGRSPYGRAQPLVRPAAPRPPMP